MRVGSHLPGTLTARGKERNRLTLWRLLRLHLASAIAFIFLPQVALCLGDNLIVKACAMQTLREVRQSGLVMRAFRVPGSLWNEVIEHRRMTAIDRRDTLSSMLIRWIEQGLKREQQEID